VNHIATGDLAAAIGIATLPTHLSHGHVSPSSVRVHHTIVCPNDHTVIGNEIIEFSLPNGAYAKLFQRGLCGSAGFNIF
jgi:hypothetical protein